MFKDYLFFSNNLQDAARQILEAQNAGSTPPGRYQGGNGGADPDIERGQKPIFPEGQEDSSYKETYYLPKEANKKLSDYAKDSTYYVPKEANKKLSDYAPEPEIRNVNKTYDPRMTRQPMPPGETPPPNNYDDDDDAPSTDDAPTVNDPPYLIRKDYSYSANKNPEYSPNRPKFGNRYLKGTEYFPPYLISKDNPMTSQPMPPGEIPPPPPLISKDSSDAPSEDNALPSENEINDYNRKRMTDSIVKDISRRHSKPSEDNALPSADETSEYKKKMMDSIVKDITKRYSKPENISKSNSLYQIDRNKTKNILPMQ